MGVSVEQWRCCIGCFPGISLRGIVGDNTSKPTPSDAEWVPFLGLCLFPLIYIAIFISLVSGSNPTDIIGGIILFTMRLFTSRLVMFILLFKAAADTLRRMLIYWEYYCPPILHVANNYPSQSLLFLIITVSAPFVIASWWLFDCFSMMSWWLFHLVKCVKRIMGSFISSVTTPPKCQSQSRRRSCFTSPAFVIIRLFFMWILCAQSVSAMESSVSRGLGISSSDLEVSDIANAPGNSGLKRKERDDNDNGSSGSDNGTNINVDERREEELDKIFKGWGNKDALKAMEAFLSSSDGYLSNGCGIKRLIKDLLVGLLDSNDAETLKSTFEKKQNELGKKIDSLKLGDEVIKSRTENDEHKEGKDGNKETWQSNFGEGLNKKTEGAAFANYAPTNDSDLQDGKHCRIPRTNSCMQKFSKSLLNSLIKELDRYSDSQEEKKVSSIPPIPDEKKEGHPGVRFIDACCVVLGKEDYHAEIRAFCNASGLTKHEFYAISLITIGYHAKYHFLINGGKPLPFLPTTANGRDNVLDYDNIKFDEDGVYTSTYIKLFQYVAHGECWGNKSYLQKFDVKAMVKMGRSFVGFYSCFEGYEGLIDLAKYEDDTSAKLSKEYEFEINGSQIAFRYSGLAFMTPEERKALVMARLFFYKSGTLASALFGKGGKQTGKNLDEGSEMGKLYKEMLDFVGGDEKTFEAKLREKYDSLRAGTEWVSSIVKQRGCFPHIDDFGQFLQAVLTLEEDGTMSSKDEKMFARFGNTLKSSYALSKYLDSEDSLPQSECQGLYQSLKEIFAEGFDTSTDKEGIGHYVNRRWNEFLERHKEINGIDGLSEFRRGQQDVNNVNVSRPTYAVQHDLAPVVNAPMKKKNTGFVM